MELLKASFRAVGWVYRRLAIRPLQRYNVENRAFKLLDKMEKSSVPIVKAPKHPPTEKYLEELIKQHPEIMENVKKTPTEIVEGVKQIKITSESVPADFNVKEESEVTRAAARELPERRRKVFLAEMGVKDPEKVPIGKVSLREAIELIVAHGNDPENFTAKKISEVHEVDVEYVEYLLDYFKPYLVYHPSEPTVPKHQTPWYSRKKLTDVYLKDIPVIETHRLRVMEEEVKQLREAIDKEEKEKKNQKMEETEDKNDVEVKKETEVEAKSKEEDERKDPLDKKTNDKKIDT